MADQRRGLVARKSLSHLWPAANRLGDAGRRRKGPCVSRQGAGRAFATTVQSAGTDQRRGLVARKSLSHLWPAANRLGFGVRILPSPQKVRR